MRLYRVQPATDSSFLNVKTLLSLSRKRAKGEMDIDILNSLPVFVFMNADLHLAAVKLK